MSKGLFIVVEGADFAGKTTFVKQLKKVLGMQDFSSVLFRSPGGLDGGEAIRELLVNTVLSEEVRTLIFSANRVDSTQKIINPLIKKGINVISTRWRWSSNVYQDNQKVADYVDEAMGVAIPDIYILLECSEEAFDKSLKARNEKMLDEDYQIDLMDQEYTQNYASVKERFNDEYEAYAGTKFKFVYNQGKPKPPTDEEFIELVKPFLSEIGYFEEKVSLGRGLTHNTIVIDDAGFEPVDESLLPQPRV